MTLRRYAHEANQSGAGPGAKRTRKREFLGEMDRVVSWDGLVGLIAPFAPQGKTGRLPLAVQTFPNRWARSPKASSGCRVGNRSCQRHLRNYRFF